MALKYYRQLDYVIEHYRLVEISNSVPVTIVTVINSVLGRYFYLRTVVAVGERARRHYYPSYITAPIVY